MFAIMDPQINLLFPNLGWVIAAIMMAGIVIRGVFNMATTRFAHFKHLDKLKTEVGETYVRQDVCAVTSGSLSKRVDDGFSHVNKKLHTIIKNGSK
jgi:hypothetical protein